MPDLRSTLPAALARQTRYERLGPTSIPALLAHPNWERPAPLVIWMHGRTVNKELDNGRYLRWIRAGIAACAIDLPGHGERLDASFHHPSRTLETIAQATQEIDQVIEVLSEKRFQGVVDLDRLAIGGMSAGGMVTLRRLCEPHPFVCAAVEGTAGNLHLLYGDGRSPHHPADRIAAMDPMQHLGSWRPLPLLALHSEADQIVPVACIRTFVEELRQRYQAAGADPATIELRTWLSTGAPMEHNGFGLAANEAKNTQLDFLTRWLRPEPVA